MIQVIYCQQPIARNSLTIAFWDGIEESFEYFGYWWGIYKTNQKNCRKIYKQIQETGCLNPLTCLIPNKGC